MSRVVACWLACFANRVLAAPVQGATQPTYDPARALEYAYLVTAAYCGYPKMPNDKTLEEWKCGPACEAVPDMRSVRAVRSGDNNDAYAFVGILGEQCVLSFRGTSDLAGWLVDLSSLHLVDLTEQGVSCSFQGQPCKVGDGFMKNYNSISAYIKTNLSALGCDKGGLHSNGLRVTGHSLGAAEAAVAMYDLKNQGYTVAESYTFGQPRVGDVVFSDAFEAAFSSILPWRLSHARDPVVHLPTFGFTDFRHLATEVFYKENTSQGYRVCDGSGEDHSCADQYTDLPLMVIRCLSDHAKHCDHLTYMQAAKTILMDGSSCKSSASSKHNNLWI